MTPDTIITIGRAALEVMIALMLVLLLPALFMGVMISMFQAATQINEQTLSFIPKLLITLVAMIVAGPWMLTLIIDYTERLMRSIPGLIG